MSEEKQEYEVVTEQRSLVERVASAVSNLFNPLLIPTYAVMMSILFSSQFDSSPTSACVSAVVMTFAITCAIPLIAIYILYRVDYISDAAVNERKDRFLPFAVAAICYATSALHLSHVNAPQWMSMFMGGASVATIITVIINVKWKISAHATAMGGLTALSFVMLVNNTLVGIDSMPLVSVIVILAGLVGTCRLYLGHHDIWQVVAGTANGFVCVYLFTSMAL